MSHISDFGFHPPDKLISERELCLLELEFATHHKLETPNVMFQTSCGSIGRMI